MKVHLAIITNINIFYNNCVGLSDCSLFSIFAGYICGEKVREPTNRWDRAVNAVHTRLARSSTTDV